MSLDADRVSTVTFDSYSTLVDVDSTQEALREHVDDADVESISRLWRTRSLEYTMVGNEIGEYQTFYEMNRDALTYALASHDADVSDDERDQILAVYHELEVFEDVRDGIERLRDAGYPCYVLSNGNPEMLESLVAHADIGDLLDDTISADEIERFKPSRELYRHAAGRTGTPIEEVVHVTALWPDVEGAIGAGMQSVWLDRKDDPWEAFGPEPDLIAETIHDVADALDA